MTYAMFFGPFIGFLITFMFAVFASKDTADRVAVYFSSIPVIFSAVLSVALLCKVHYYDFSQTFPLWDWLEGLDLKVSFGLQLDILSALMICVVNIVSACVHVYSLGYMSHDNEKAKFMSYLSLFTFAMLILVLSPNLIQLFLGWEGVGLCSYLLIGFWNHRESANNAAIKAFVMNRIGDLGLVLAMCLCYFCFQTLDFSTMIKTVLSSDLKIYYMTSSLSYLDLLGIFMLIGAMGKSAQFGLHTWLPDAMEGPTPVSALIHAATMVTAGVFLLVRMSPILTAAPQALMLVTIIGTITCFFAATVALVQTDIKRVIAYSTCSQLGYMILAVGIGMPNAAMFHLITHAFFKALLFLGAGSVIHAMSGEQNMSKMGGIYKMIPYTYVFMWIGTLAIVGFPLLSGYFSKDLILEGAYINFFKQLEGNYSLTSLHMISRFVAWILPLSVVMLTTFYSLRVIFKTFHGQSQADEKTLAHIHESPFVMLLPLMVLAIGSIFAGWYLYHAMVNVTFWKNTLLETSFDQAGTRLRISELVHHIPYWYGQIILLFSIIGSLVAYFFYQVGPKARYKITASWKKTHQFLLFKWYIDELYQIVFVRTAHQIGRFFWQKGDLRTIDRFGPDGLTAISLNLSQRFIRMQSGYVYHYVTLLAIGLVFFAGWYFLSQGINLP